MGSAWVFCCLPAHHRPGATFVECTTPAVSAVVYVTACYTITITFTVLRWWYQQHMPFLVAIMPTNFLLVSVLIRLLPDTCTSSCLTISTYVSSVVLPTGTLHCICWVRYMEYSTDRYFYHHHHLPAAPILPLCCTDFVGGCMPVPPTSRYAPPAFSGSVVPHVVADFVVELCWCRTRC